LNWSNIPVEHPADGIERTMFVGNRMMICPFSFQAISLVTPEHDHPHEQMTIVERGHVRFFIEGKEQNRVAGDVLHFPSNCWHGAR
jgi:quercetin dioxygenase-like cupin family protein